MILRDGRGRKMDLGASQDINARAIEERSKSLRRARQKTKRQRELTAARVRKHRARQRNDARIE